MIDTRQTFAQYRADLEEELRDILLQREGLLYTMMQYQLEWIDQQGAPLQGRPDYSPLSMLCLMSCHALAEDHLSALPAAAALELINHYSLIHADIREGEPERHHNPTVWWVWGPGQAINAGDGMHALGRLALLRLQQKDASIDRTFSALYMLDEACLTMCEGQEMDLAFQESLNVGIDSYMKMVAKRQGALMGCAMGLGALTAGRGDPTLDSFKECGANLGVATQIWRDISEIWPPSPQEPPSSHILNKKKSLPIVYLLNKGAPGQKRKLGTIYFKRVLEPHDLEQIREILGESDARQFCEDTAQNHYMHAMDALKQTESASWLGSGVKHLVDLLISSDRW